MVEDLSTYHKLIGELFKRPDTPEEWTEYRLSDEQVKFYRENGYLEGDHFSFVISYEAHMLSYLT